MPLLTTSPGSSEPLCLACFLRKWGITERACSVTLWFHQSLLTHGYYTGRCEYIFKVVESPRKSI